MSHTVLSPTMTGRRIRNVFIEALHPAWWHAKAQENQWRRYITTAFTGFPLPNPPAELNSHRADQF